MGTTFIDLILDKTGRIGTVTLNRPERLNALGANTTFEIYQAIKDLASDPAIKVIVLTGNGRAFCAGGDFKDNFLEGMKKTTIEWRERIRTGANKLVKLLVDCEKPVIASINGLAVGGGATIALACDVRIASEKAKFMLPFSSIGLTPEFGCTYLLPRIVGLGKALELLYTGDFIDSHEALRIGLINKIVAHEDLKINTTAFAEKILEKPFSALGMLKSLVYRSLSNDLITQLELEAFAISIAFKTDEHEKSVRAFLQKQKGD
jgi:2-(1,2-epoxy-1,2-dihydrophenyl)acetyl-CoA isomerase